MAKKVMGLTLEIGGETTTLQKSLSAVNKHTRELSTELRQVDRLLKLDPKNTELVAQKQKVLADAVGETSDKLDALKDAEKQVQDQFKRGEIGEDQYRAIQQEVIKTEQDLKSLETQLKHVNSKWDDAQKKIGNFGTKSTAAGKAMMPVTTGILAAGGAALALDISFGDAMAKVSTISDATVPIEELEKQILSLSNETGVAANEVAENVYNAISAGQDTADAVAFVGEATKLSKAGFAESGEALDILTTIMNAYGLEASEVGVVSDMLIQTQNKGKVTVGELSQAMGKIIPTANAVGLGLDQVGASYALLTSNGIKAAEATTYTNSLLNELAKTGSKSSKVLEKETGKSFSELLAEGKSLSDVLMILGASAKESGVGLTDMFGSAEAGKAALVLAKDSGAAFNETQAQMNASGGATQEAFEKMQTSGENFRISLNKMKNSLMSFGDTLAPVFESISAAFEKVATFMSKLTPEQRKLVVGILAVVAAIGPVLIVVGKIATGISALMGVFSALSGAASVVGAAIGAISLPVVAVIAAIAAVIAIGVALYKNWDKIKEVAAVVFENVKEGIGNAIESIKGFFGSVVEKGKNLVTSFKDLGKNIIQGLIDGFMGMLGKVKDAVGNIAGTITGGFKKLLGINSPSKVFAGFGENTGEGFIEGIKATKRDIDKATADMVNLDGMQTSLGNVNAGVSSGATKGTVRHVIDMNLNVTGETGQLNIQHIAAAVEQKIVEAITNGDRRVGSRPRLVMG